MRVLIIGDVFHTKQLEAILRQAGIAPVFANSRQLPTTPADVLEADMAIVGADHGDHRPVKGYSFLQKIPLVIPSRGEHCRGNRHRSGGGCPHPESVFWLRRQGKPRERRPLYETHSR